MQDVEHSIGFLISDVSRLLRRNFNRRAQELGLSLAQCRALAYLSRQEGVNQVTLADSLEIQPITVVRLIDKLQEMGLVTREPDPADRRAIRLFLTTEAQPLLRRMWELSAETREEAATSISSERRNALIATLNNMKQNLLSVENRSSSTGSSGKYKMTGNVKNV